MLSLSCPAVWVIDDDEDDQLLIRTAFNGTTPPVNILTLDDGDQLLPRLAASAELPRLILLDINMSQQNGFETLQQLRSVPDYASVPVVMLTTSSNDTDHRRSLALGADHFLTKPHNYEQLSTLAQQLSRQWLLY